MKNGHHNIIASPWLRFWLLLMLVCSGQVASFCHSVHSHDENSVEFASHPVDFDEEHLLHHQEAHSESDDQQHTYNKQIYWCFTRAQSQRTATIDDQYIFSYDLPILTSDNNSSCFDYGELLFSEEYCASASVIRGPPLQG